MENIPVSANTDEIVFITPLEAEIGYLYFEGKRVRTGRNRSYHIRKWFKEKQKLNGTRFTMPRNYRRKYCLLVDRHKNDYGMLPALKLYTPYGVCYAIIIPSDTQFARSELMLQATIKTADLAIATARVEEDHLVGELNYVRKEKSRKAVIELVVKYHGRCLWSLKATEIIASTENMGKTTYNYSLVPDEPAIVFVTKPGKTLVDTFKNIYGKPPIMLGYSGCKAKLRLRLDIPLRKDIFDEKPLKLEPVLG